MIEAVVPVLLAVLYVRRVRTLAGSPRAVPGWRQACFLGGTALIVAATTAPVGDAAEDRFWVHMAEHLLIADLGALLLVLGLTANVLAPVVRRAPWLRVFTHPVVALGLWALSLFTWHIAALYEGALDHGALHALQHAMFIGFGVAMWMALLGPLPRPAWFGNLAKLLYIVAVRLLGTVLANVLLWTETLYPHYDDAGDQKIGAGIMMVEGSIITLLLFGWLFIRAGREGEERQELLDLAVERGYPLDERRAARAVSAGRGPELRERILAGSP
jgi:putative membrane protein